MKRGPLTLIVSAAAAVLACAWVARHPAPLAAHPTLAREPASLAANAERPAVDAAFAAQDRQRELEWRIEHSLVARDRALRETAFALLLPELMSSAPERAVALLARLAPGEERDALLEEIARRWVSRDAEAALQWIESLGDERDATARVAVSALAAVSPAQAIDAADRLGVGRDDGSVEHIVQVWAADRPEDARRWLDAQPDSLENARLRARLPRLEPPAAGTYDIRPTESGT